VELGAAMDTLMMEPTITLDTLTELNHKIDRLTEQVAFLAEEAYQQRRQRQEWEDLKDDLVPVGMDMYRVVVNELEEIEPHVQLEDILHLMKRLLRNTRNLEQMLDQLESLAELSRDINPLSQDAFITVMMRLDELERKGYFTFARSGMDILDRVVTHFTPEDLEQLGENVVLILETVKEMTQPDIMRLVSQTAHVVREEEVVEAPSMMQLLRQLNDPAVRRGLSMTLNIVKSVSDQN
jgi:uncharacterized protein YjgD (DUF1641 family)